MGFSLDFMRLGPDEVRDADREGLARWLDSRGLEIGPSNDAIHHLRGSDGPLTFDGHETDLHLSPLDQDGPVTGGIWHARLSPDECSFVYDLCVAGRMLILNPQGSPLLVIPRGSHAAADLPPSFEASEIAWIDSAGEMAEALSGGFERFLEFRERVIEDPAEG
jgi:hypothetical protein